MRKCKTCPNKVSNNSTFCEECAKERIKETKSKHMKEKRLLAKKQKESQLPAIDSKWLTRGKIGNSNKSSITDG